MSSPVNIQRDCTFVTIDRSLDVPFGPSSAFYNIDTTANTNPAVHADYFNIQNKMDDELTVGEGQMATFGSFITPPKGDRQPYRVKGSLLVPVGGDAVGALVVGWGEAAPTGTADPIRQVRVYPFQNYFDALVNIDQPPVSYVNSPLFFGIALIGTKVNTNVRVTANISVQNLGVKPPTMQNAIS